MAYSRNEVIGRALHFATKNDLVLEEELGFGVHGIVWATDQRSAVKVHGLDRRHYERERDIYLRLQDNELTRLLGFHVPRLRAFDDDLMAIEVAIVQPPFVLDFAGAYLDQAPDFSPQVWADWEVEKQEQFGNNWSKAKAVIAAFRRYGIYLSDVSPSNIRCI
jgi:hypothetical protein